MIYTCFYDNLNERDSIVASINYFIPAGVRRTISYDKPLIKDLNVFENITLPFLYHYSSNELNLRLKIEDMLTEFEIESIMYTYPRDLVPIQTVKVRYLQSIVMDPQVICFVEPSHFFKFGYSRLFMAFLKSLVHENIIVVEHSEYRNSYKDLAKEIGVDEWIVISKRLLNIE